MEIEYNKKDRMIPESQEEDNSDKSDRTRSEEESSYDEECSSRTSSKSSESSFRSDDDDENDDKESENESDYTKNSETSESEQEKDYKEFKQKRRKRYTIDYKLKIVKQYEDGIKVKAICENEGIDEKQVRDWVKKKGEFLLIPKRQEKQIRSLKYGIKIQKHQDIFQSCFNWVQSQWDSDQGVITLTIINYFVQNDDQLYNKKYKYLTNLCFKFRKRFQLSLRVPTLKIQIQEDEKFQRKISEFRDDCAKIISKFKIKNENILNFDQTAVYFYNTPSKIILIIKGGYFQPLATTVKIMVVLLLFPDFVQIFALFVPFIIFKGEKNGRIKQELIKNNNEKVYSTTQNKGWTNNKVMKEYLKFISNLLPRHKKYLTLCYSYGIHLSSAKDILEIQRSSDQIKFIPPHSTPLLQPLDIRFIKSFKWKLKDQSGNQQNIEISRQKLIENVLKARESVSNESIINSFKSSLPCLIN